jgi:hypothetical protein
MAEDWVHRHGQASLADTDIFPEVRLGVKKEIKIKKAWGT